MHHATGAADFPKAFGPTSNRRRLPPPVLGISSGFGFAMIGATLTTRLAQDGIRKSAVTAFALTFLAYNFKWLWAPLVDTVRIPVLGRFGQRRSWLWFVGVLVMAAVVFLGSRRSNDGAADGGGRGRARRRCRRDLRHRHRRLSNRAARTAAAGRRVGHVAVRLADRRRAAGALALVIAARYGWAVAYFACALFALPAMLVGLVMGEPARRREPPATPREPWQAVVAYFSPLAEFLQREGAVVVLLFVLIHKIGDTLANLTLRLLFEDLGFTNDEIAFYDVGVGFIALLVGHLRRRRRSTPAWA